MDDDEDQSKKTKFRDWITKVRNKIAWRLASASLKIATPWYRNMIGGSIRYGMKAAARDADHARRTHTDKHDIIHHHSRLGE